MGVVLSLLAVLIGLIPAWVFLGVRALAEPEGFWQELALGLVGMFFLGAMQLIFLVGLAIMLAWIWSETEDDVDIIRREQRQMS